MKAKDHLWTSLVAGGLLCVATGSTLAIAGAVTGGFLIDADHFVDQLLAISMGDPDPVTGARRHRRPGEIARTFFRHRKFIRLPLLLHSYELVLLLAAITAFERTPFLIGLESGYALHLFLDLVKHRGEFLSPWFYLLSYRLAHGFRRERLVRPEYL